MRSHQRWRRVACLLFTPRLLYSCTLVYFITRTQHRPCLTTQCTQYNARRPVVWCTRTCIRHFSLSLFSVLNTTHTCVCVCPAHLRNKQRVAFAAAVQIYCHKTAEIVRVLHDLRAQAQHTGTHTHHKTSICVMLCAPVRALFIQHCLRIFDLSRYTTPVSLAGSLAG